jgi:hypothetical protein
MQTEAREAGERGPRALLIGAWAAGLLLLGLLAWLLFRPAAPVPVAQPVTAAAPASATAPVPAVHRIAIRIADGHVAGSGDTFQVKQGEAVELSFTSDKAIMLHLHGYEVHADVDPQQGGAMSFKADMAGRFPVHEHRQGAGNHRAVLFVEVHP